MSTFVPAASLHQVTNWKKSAEPAVAVVFRRKEVLIDSASHALPYCSDAARFAALPNQALEIGTLNGRRCLGVELPTAENTDLPPTLAFVETRLALANLPPGSGAAICRARELVVWRRQHRFCGACGAETVESDHDTALVCPRCGGRFYPQIAPAVIVAVLRGNEILLAHNRNFSPHIHGLIAGFVEAGENVEQAIVREIYEETGIEVGNISYRDSQSWPFPNSLMLGFTAEYRSGEAQADGEELESLGWFKADELPEIPPPGSIARKLIDQFVAGGGSFTAPPSSPTPSNAR